MKKDIHPEYKETTITCSCGNTFKIQSTQDNFAIEICSACHPFYTGKDRVVDTEGRVKKFKSKLTKSQEKKKETKPKKERKTNKKDTTLKLS